MDHPTLVPMTFESASAFWITWCNRDVEAAGVGDQFQSSEQVILSHEAKSLEEAATQLSVVIDAMIGGGRSDGLDVDVVRRAQALIREAVRLAPAPENLARARANLPPRIRKRPPDGNVSPL